MVTATPRVSLCVSASAQARLARVEEWLGVRDRAGGVLLVGASTEAVASAMRPVALRAGATFGWTRVSFGRLAAMLAGPVLAERGLVPAGALALEALCARVVHKLADVRALGRFEGVGDRPGLPRALARSIHELRLAQIAPARLRDDDLRRVYEAYEAELMAAKLADRADVLRVAAARAASGDEPILGVPTLLLDVPVTAALERELVAALAARAPDVLVTCPRGDARARRMLEWALGVRGEEVELALSPAPADALARLQEGLFREDAPRAGEAGDRVAIMSAPGESRECVEIARRVLREAARGAPFDQMAVLLRATPQYRAHLEEAFRRAEIPVHFAQGTVVPDPAGRALLALLACASEGLSARRFAEYVSLGEVPDADAQGEPPAAPPSGERHVAPDEEALSGPVSRARAEELAQEEARPVLSDTAPVAGGTLRAPRRWERLLVEAAVIGGRDRWRARLDGLRKERELDLAELDADDPARERIARELSDLDALRRYALPLLDALAALPGGGPPGTSNGPRSTAVATWAEWLDALGALAARALRRPERVIAVLGELSPMAEVGQVTLREVRLALGRRLTELSIVPSERRYGKVFVGTTDQARGLSFEVVFVPGVAEKLFPQKVAEDPILRDAERARLREEHASELVGAGAGSTGALLASELVVNADRVEKERLALHLATGAARARVCVSYPRIDTEQSRPRTPSFYGLEVLRAAEGRLPGFDELAKRAEAASMTRLGWPAPASPHDAIDDAEHDLSLLAQVFKRPVEETAGTARYLLGANVHLARALRFRYARWDSRAWQNADGLVSPRPFAKDALARHQLAARSFSPTALQNFATCPYKFVLYALHKLSPREEPEALEELNPLQKGSLVHEVLFELHVRLEAEGLLPVRAATLEAARRHLDAVTAEVAAKHADDLAPAIPRVWDDGVAAIKADLVEWLRRGSVEDGRDASWVPAHFELSFGLTERRAQDAASRDDDVKIDAGLRLRGSIDLVERREGGVIRATDYKTGKARAKDGATVIGGGEILQPVLYALVLEKLFPGVKVDGGRLYYLTSSGDFKDVFIRLDDEARDGARLVGETIGQALAEGFLPAAPIKGGCEYCDYKVVCGPYEEMRTKKKNQAKLKALVELRSRR